MIQISASKIFNARHINFSEQGLIFKIGTTGFTSIKYEGIELNNLSAGKVFSGATVPDGSTTFYSDAVTSISKPSPNTVLQNMQWGFIQTTYSSIPTGFQLFFDIKNTLANTITILNLIMFGLILPEQALVYSYYTGPFGGVEHGSDLVFPFYGGDVIGDPRPASLTLTTSKFLVRYTEDIGNIKSCNISFVPASSANTKNIYLDSTLYNIDPNEEINFSFTFEFRPPDSAIFNDATVLNEFRTQYPFTLNWIDRRPIGTVFMASSAVNTATNPRKWITQYNIDITTPEGLSSFQSSVISFAQNSATIALETNAQGIITWDIEGEQPGGVYWGAPELIGALAPEMESIVNYLGTNMPLVDAYFKIFRDAGLRVGLTVRPSQVIASGGYYAQISQDEAASYLDLYTSINYAINRWQCSLFYIDSSASTEGILSLATMQQLAADFPNVLLIPEVQIFTHYTCTAPWDSLDAGVARTNPNTRRVWPETFSIIATGSPSVDDESKILDGMINGDIYLFNTWYHNSTQQLVADLYYDATH